MVANHPMIPWGGGPPSINIHRDNPYVLMQQIRLRAARTSCARAQVQTLRERLLKVGAHVVVSVRRVVLHLPASYPFLDAWKGVARALGAQT